MDRPFIATDDSNDTRFPTADLHRAVANNDADLVASILSKDVSSIHVQDANGDQPCHIACRHGYIDCVRLMIEYDAEMGRKNWAGLTPMGEARMNGRTDVIAILKSNFAFGVLVVEQPSREWDASISNSTPDEDEFSRPPVASSEELLRLRDEKCKVNIVRRIHPNSLPSQRAIREQRLKAEQHEREWEKRIASALKIQLFWRRARAQRKA